jgi:hypothetical protein
VTGLAVAGLVGFSLWELGGRGDRDRSSAAAGSSTITCADDAISISGRTIEAGRRGARLRFASRRTREARRVHPPKGKRSYQRGASPDDTMRSTCESEARSVPSAGRERITTPAGRAESLTVILPTRSPASSSRPVAEGTSRPPTGGTPNVSAGEGAAGLELVSLGLCSSPVEVQDAKIAIASTVAALLSRGM